MSTVHDEGRTAPVAGLELRCSEASRLLVLIVGDESRIVARWDELEPFLQAPDDETLA